MERHRTAWTLGALAALALAGVACSDDDQDDLSESVESVAEDLEDAARSAATEVEDAVDDAAEEVEEAVDDVATDAVETAARNIATEQGEEQFSDAGYPIDDDGLSCEADAADDLSAVEIDCAGTTEDGEEATLTGTTSEVPGESITELEGDFTGTVDGAEVFTAQTLGG